MFFTPPFCPAVYVASTMAGSNMWRTAFQSMKLGIVCYLIPILLIFKPALLLMGPAGEIVTAVVTSIIGALFLATGVEGYFLANVPWYQRIMFITGGLCLFTPEWITDLVGIGIVIIPTILQLKQWRLGRSLLQEA